MHLIHKSLRACLLLVLGLTLFSSCKDEYQERFKEQQKADEEFIQSYLTANQITTAQRQASGVYYLPQTTGNGTKVQKTSTVTYHSIGRLLNYGSSKFESTYEDGQTKRTKLGMNYLVKGLEEGLSLMQEGEKATIIVPSGQAYGRTGNYTTVPGNAVLLYEITIEKVE
ncbi:MAG: FKBP-type peptidyl-prolyl cis-trans isomerase [Adhaeribacter sp.]